MNFRFYPDKVSNWTKRRISFSVLDVLAILAFIGTTGALLNYVAVQGAALFRAGDGRVLAGFVALYGPILLIMIGYVYYLIAQYGYQKRLRDFSPEPLERLLELYRGAAPPMVTLVPSYKEEERTMRQTLVSAGLAEHPDRRVVLLVDDPPNPRASEDLARLAIARGLPGVLSAKFAAACAPFAEALDAFGSHGGSNCDGPDVLDRVADLYELAAQTLERWAQEEKAERGAAHDHTDRLFIERILGEPARAHRARAATLRETPNGASAIVELRRLAALFRCDFTGFERKLYQNLSHVANKAQNLNSYISVVGGAFREVVRADGLYLERCDERDATLSFPHAHYIATVDADSLITSDYALKLVEVLERPGNERLALIQTPYTAIPGSAILLERIAGATTDLHYFVQQGVSAFDAAYWVGPNALIRKAALDDIVTLVEERGHQVRVFIQDRTVIEDTGATIDLIGRGWRLFNYLDRLCYSATPADFGALLIQRRRWANGGLLLLPSLLAHLSYTSSPIAAIGAFLRIFTLVAPTIVSVSILLLILVSFDDRFVLTWLPLAALPYYILLGRDLKASGHRLTDLPRVYAMNVTLVPIVLGGVLQSLRQGLTGEKPRFARTPKIAGRTTAPIVYLAALYAIFLFCAVSLLSSVEQHKVFHMALSAVLTCAFGYGLYAFVGFGNAWADTTLWLAERSAPARARLARARAWALSVGSARLLGSPIVVEDRE